MATLLAAERQGSRDLVLLHGWGLNSEVWNSIELRLAPHFRIHKVDLRVTGAVRNLVKCH